MALLAVTGSDACTMGWEFIFCFEGGRHQHSGPVGLHLGSFGRARSLGCSSGGFGCFGIAGFFVGGGLTRGLGLGCSVTHFDQGGSFWGAALAAAALGLGRGRAGMKKKGVF